MAWHADVVARAARSVGCELIAPLVEHIAVRIRADREMEVDIKRDRIPFVNSGATSAKSLGRAPRSFKVLGVEDAA